MKRNHIIMEDMLIAKDLEHALLSMHIYEVVFTNKGDNSDVCFKYENNKFLISTQSSGYKDKEFPYYSWTNRLLTYAQDVRKGIYSVTEIKYPHIIQ